MGEMVAQIVNHIGAKPDIQEIDLSRAIGISFKLRNGVWIRVSVKDGLLHIMGDNRLAIYPVAPNVVDIDESF